MKKSVVKLVVKSVFITLFCVALLGLLFLNVLMEYSTYQNELLILKNQTIIRAGQQAIYQELVKQKKSGM